MDNIDSLKGPPEATSEALRQQSKLLNCLLTQVLEEPPVAIDPNTRNSLLIKEELPAQLSRIVTKISTPIDTKRDQAVNEDAEAEALAYVHKIVSSSDKSDYLPILEGLFMLYVQHTAKQDDHAAQKPTDIQLRNGLKDPTFLLFLKDTLTDTFRKNILARKWYEEPFNALAIDPATGLRFVRGMITIAQEPLTKRITVDVMEHLAQIVIQIPHPKVFIFRAKKLRDEKQLEISDQQIDTMAHILYGKRFEYAEQAAALSAEGAAYREQQAARGEIKKGLDNL